MPHLRRSIARSSIPTRRQSGWQLPDVVYQFHDGPESLFRRHLPRAPPARPHSLHGQIDDPNLPGEIQVSITLKEVSCGTELNIVQEGVPGVIPAEMCYLGWQESLIALGNLVEVEIPG